MLTNREVNVDVTFENTCDFMDELVEPSILTLSDIHVHEESLSLYEIIICDRSKHL